MTDDNKTAWIEAALKQFERPLIRYVMRLTGDVETARDIVQEAFLKLCQADRAQVDGHLAAWLYTVCRNRALDVRKKESRMNALDETTAANTASLAAGPGAVAEWNETRRRVVEALEGLPDQHQEAFRLKFEEDLTYREISQVLGVSLGTVSIWITGALLLLRERLRGELDLAGEG